MLKAPELDKCFQDETTILCPEHILHTVEYPSWLGMPWTPSPKIVFNRLHKIVSPCRHTPLVLLLGGRYYLSTGFHNLRLYSHYSKTQLSLPPLSILHIPCTSSFQYQKGGLGTCPQVLQFSIPVFQTNRFTYIPWTTVNTSTVNISAPDFPIPDEFTFDNSTLVSLDHTYNLLHKTLTQRLTKLRDDISQLQSSGITTSNAFHC